VKSIIILGAYAYDKNSDYSLTRKELRGKTARTYAYYPVVRKIAKKVANYINEAGYSAIDGQQIPLKYVSQALGIGSYGWNGLLFTPQFGSYVALRCILTNAVLAPDEFTQPDPICDNCGKCLKACPTGALYEPYKVDPKLCINPISRKEDRISPKIRDKMQNWLCGCDICQQVCPKNRELEPRTPDPDSGFFPENHASHKILEGLTRTPKLMDILRGDYNSIVTRNAIIALGNIGNRETKEDLLAFKRENKREELDEYLLYAIERIKSKN
jgi:epoxyqueuosine reductase